MRTYANLLRQPEYVKEGRKGTEPIDAVGSKSTANVCARSSRGCWNSVAELSRITSP